MNETNALDLLEFVRDTFKDELFGDNQKPSAAVDDKKKMTNEEILKIPIEPNSKEQAAMYKWLSDHPNATEAERVEFKKQLLGID